MSQSMAVAYNMKKKKQGESSVSEAESPDLYDDDIVDRVMDKRMADGDLVEDLADALPADFSNPLEGEEDVPESDDRHDIVGKVMRKRSAPRPA